jgi:hypothetical protein
LIEADAVEWKAGHDICLQRVVWWLKCEGVGVRKVISVSVKMQAFVHDIIIACQTRPMTIIGREETGSAQLFSASASLPSDAERR